MKSVICVLGAALLLSLTSDECGAQYLSYKEDIWGKMEYTWDGVDFQEFGGGWKHLFKEVESNDKALRLLRDARNLHYAGMGCSIAGAAMLGFAAGLESREEHVDDGYWIAGAAFAVVGIGCRIAGKLKLDKGFLEYNRGKITISDRSRGINGVRLALTPSRAGLILYF